MNHIRPSLRVSDRNGPIARLWSNTYELVWGGLKRLVLPDREGAYRILSGPGRGVRLWTNPTRGGTRVLLGRYEPPLMMWLRRAVRPGSTFYDIGSNDGHVALVAASLAGKNGAVYAFEPDAAIRKRLQANLELNPDLASRITVMPFEVGRTHEPDAGRISIDGILAQPGGMHRTPDAIKIDVEGAEAAVIDGLSRLVGERCPSLFVECHSEELERHIKAFFGSRDRQLAESTPSIFEVSRHGYNSWLYLIES